MTRNKDTEYNNDHYNNNNNSNNYNKFERKISRLFDDFLNDVGFTRTHSSKFRGGVDDKHSTWSPAIDIKEVDREYLVIADVPGVRKEDIDIELHESVLVLSGHLNQDIYSSPQAQEINIGKDNRQHPPQQPNQYLPPQQYQQQPPPQPYQQTTEPQPYQQTTEPQKYQQTTEPQKYQQTTEPQKYQQTTEPQNYQQTTEPQNYQQTTEPQKYQQQPSAAQQYQQTVEQKYNLSNEPQQQSNLPQQYQQMPNDPHQSNDPHYQQQSNEFHHIKNRRQQEPFRGDKFHIQERPYGHFSRSIQLPTNIKSDDEFYATLENGVLKIRIPKNNDKPKRKITIK